MTPSQRRKTLACFVLIHLATLTGSATEIHLKARAESKGSVVLLGDIAIVKADAADPAVDASDATSLARIELFPAPDLSRSRTVRRREIRELLGLHGADLRTIRFAGAESVVIRTSQRPRINKVKNEPLRFEGPGGAFSYTKPMPLANRTIKQPAIKQPAIEQPATELVVASVRGVRRGEIIRRSNVVLMPVPVDGRGSATSLGIKPAIHTEDVIGMAATRTIPANQPLDVRALQRPIVVKRGDLITVTSLAPGVRVETVARATENAAQGDLVIVEALVNRKKYSARVTGEKSAEVFAGGIKVSSPPTPQPKKKTTTETNQPSSERRASQ